MRSRVTPAAMACLGVTMLSLAFGHVAGAQQSGGGMWGDEWNQRQSETAAEVNDGSVAGAVWATQLGEGPGGWRGSGRALPPPSCSFVAMYDGGRDLDGVQYLTNFATMTGEVVWRPRRSDYPTSNIGEGPGRLYEVACVRTDDPRYYRVQRTVFVAALTPQQLAEAAFNQGLLSLPVLTVDMSPPLGADQLVALETWVWFPEAEWQDVALDVPALFTVLTIGATPTRAEWHMGDGGLVACPDRGVEYSPEAASVGAAHCGYTYQRSSAREADLSFDGHVDVFWEAWFEVDGGPRVSLGEAPPQTTPFEVRVAEAQAINTGGLTVAGPGSLDPVGYSARGAAAAAAACRSLAAMVGKAAWVRSREAHRAQTEWAGRHRELFDGRLAATTGEAEGLRWRLERAADAIEAAVHATRRRTGGGRRCEPSGRGCGWRTGRGCGGEKRRRPGPSRRFQPGGQ